MKGVGKRDVSKRVEEGADHLFPVFSQLQTWRSYFC